MFEQIFKKGTKIFHRQKWVGYKPNYTPLPPSCQYEFVHSMNGYLFLPPKTSFEKNKVFFFLTGYIGYSHYELWPFATIWFHWRIFPFWIRTNKFGRSKYFGHVFSITVAQFQSKRSTSRTCGCSRRVGIFYIEWLSKS